MAAAGAGEVGVAAEEGTRIHPQSSDMHSGNLSTESSADRDNRRGC